MRFWLLLSRYSFRFFLPFGGGTARPKLLFVDLARRSERQILHKFDDVGHAPAIEPRREMRAHRVFGQTGRGPGLDEQERALAPFFMRDPDDGAGLDVGVRGGGFLDRDRADPFAARLDHILGAVGDLRSEEHTSELQSLMRISYAVFC